MPLLTVELGDALGRGHIGPLLDLDPVAACGLAGALERQVGVAPQDLLLAGAAEAVVQQPGGCPFGGERGTGHEGESAADPTINGTGAQQLRKALSVTC